MTADTRDPAAAERYEHAVRMALEAWDVTSGEVIETNRGQHTRRIARDHFEAYVRERLAQTAQVYEAAIDEARHD